MANSVDLDEVAHNEPPLQDLTHLQIQLFSSLVAKGLFEPQIYTRCKMTCGLYCSQSFKNVRYSMARYVTRSITSFNLSNFEGGLYTSMNTYTQEKEKRYTFSMENTWGTV